MKLKEITATSITFYITMTIVGIFLIFLYVLVDCFECVGIVICAFSKKLLEFVAAGVFPSILVAFITDVANTKRQEKYYIKFYDDSLKVLKAMCENLPAELHSCMIDIYRQRKEVSESEWERKETFSEWCRILYDTKDRNQIQYMQQEVIRIKVEATKVLENLNAYQAYHSEENNNAIENLISGCNTFCRRVYENGKYTENYECHPNKLIQAVVDLFPIELPENKDIKIGYSRKFNSYDYGE